MLLRPRVALVAALAALAVAAAAPRADAFCRATTCKDRDDCGGGTDPGCIPLAWKRDCVGFAVQEDASGEIPFDRARSTLETAFAIWQQADCGGIGPGLALQYMGKVACDKVEFNLQAGNVNVMVFRDGVWPHPDGTHNLALTTVTFDPDSGELYNADIEVNTAGYDFIDGDRYDLLSVLTHEAGHFLGLSHSQSEEATMYFAYTDFSTDFRTLDVDDLDGICSVYPPAELDPQCNPIPRHGFSGECGTDQVVGGCSAAGAGEPARSGLLAAAAALAAAGIRNAMGGRRAAGGRRGITGRSGRRGSPAAR